MSFDLLPHQIIGSDFLAARRHAGLFDDMGLGKTAQTIRALDLIHARRGMIVCPASVRQAWVGEFKKFGRIHRNIVKAINLNDFNMWRRGQGDVLITSYEMAAKWAKLVAEDCLIMDFVVLDESHYLKSDSAVRTNKILGPDADGTGLVQWADRVWSLTGTPIPNDPIDIHSFLRSSGALDLDRNAFRKEYFVSQPRTYSISHEVRPERRDDLKRLIDAFSLRRTLATAGIVLPEIFITGTTIDGDTHAVRDMLRRYPGLDKIIVELVEGERSFASLTMSEAGHVATMRRVLGEAKALPYAKMLLDELQGGLDKAVVFGIHVDALAIAKGYLETHGIKCVSVTGSVKEADRVKNMIAFQDDPDCRVFFGNIRAAGVGLTLTSSSRIDMLESDWTPAGNAQAIKRVHRISQTRDVRARFITLADSFDEVVNQIVAEKTARIAELDEASGEYAPP